MKPRPIDEYHEDMGDVLWWKFPITEAPYVGRPTDLGLTVQLNLDANLRTYADPEGKEHSFVITRAVGGWPGYHTHFTLIELPDQPAAEHSEPTGCPHCGARHPPDGMCVS